MRLFKKISAEAGTIAKMFVILLTILFAIFSFIEMDLNPQGWSVWSRVVSSLLLVVAMGYVTRNVYD